MQVSNCCSAPFIIGYKEDGERCSACKEHCGEEKGFEFSGFVRAQDDPTNTIYEKLDEILPDV